MTGALYDQVKALLASGDKARAAEGAARGAEQL